MDDDFMKSEVEVSTRDLKILADQGVAIGVAESINIAIFYTNLEEVKAKIESDEPIKEKISDIVNIIQSVSFSAVKLATGIRQRKLPNESELQMPEFHAEYAKLFIKVEETPRFYDNPRYADGITKLRNYMIGHRNALESSYTILKNEIKALDDLGLSEESLNLLNNTRDNIKTAHFVTSAVIRYMETQK